MHYEYDFDSGSWHPPLIVPSYLEDDDVCSECGRPFIDIRTCEKCNIATPFTLWHLVRLPDSLTVPSDTHCFIRIMENGTKDLFNMLRIPISEVSRFARMVDCRNLVDGPESYADTFDMGDGVTGLNIDRMMQQVVDVAIEGAARRVVKLCVWEGMRTKALVREVAHAIREEMKL